MLKILNVLEIRTLNFLNFVLTKLFNTVFPKSK
jgi:hypothetical protein